MIIIIAAIIEHLLCDWPELQVFINIISLNSHSTEYLSLIPMVQIRLQRVYAALSISKLACCKLASSQDLT